jgi:hypothetical protein
MIKQIDPRIRSNAKVIGKPRNERLTIITGGPNIITKKQEKDEEEMIIPGMSCWRESRVKKIYDILLKKYKKETNIYSLNNGVIEEFQEFDNMDKNKLIIKANSICSNDDEYQKFIEKENHKIYQFIENDDENDDENVDIIGKKETISIIIPYMHSDERYFLLEKCIESLRFNDPDFNIEICIFEIGPERNLYMDDDIKYLYEEYNKPFHRGWAINRAAKKLSTGKSLIIMDCDIIVTKEWWNEVKYINTPKVGWKKIICFDEESTQKILINKMGDLRQESIKTPSINTAAGGITICPRKIFFELKGIPEDFIDTWGGEDNAFWAKLEMYGYRFSNIKSKIFHLWHTKSTPRNQKKLLFIWDIFGWDNKKWKIVLDEIGDNWGRKDAYYPDFYSKNVTNTEWTYGRKRQVLDKREEILKSVERPNY